MNITIKLRKDHDELAALVSNFRILIGQPLPPVPMDLLNFRGAFSKELLAHLTREDWLLYPVLLQSSSPGVAATAQMFIDEMGGLLQAFKTWSIRWPTDRIGNDWPQFRADTAELLDALLLRVQRENDELYPLIEGDMAQAA